MTANPKLFPLILAIDTSCDDTSVAITYGRVVLSNVVASQTQLHKQYGGVFPTVAKQAHKDQIQPSIKAAIERAGINKGQLSAIAVTQGPGLAPALEVGIEAAKELATELRLPLIPINHLEGHVLSVLAEPKPQGKKGLTVELAEFANHVMKTTNIEWPILAMIVSGKQTSFILVKGIGEYETIGQTLDDAAGEALDKFGRMVDLGYPAGPVIEEFAAKGNDHAYPFPLPMTTSGDFNLSFSGMKTSARNLTEQMQAKLPLTQQVIYDLCASFQTAVFRAITYKLNKVLQNQTVYGIWLGGGVASNMKLRAAIRETIKPYKLKLEVPFTKKLCSDNAAMIGVAAAFHFQNKEKFPRFNTIERLPRWPL